MALTRRTPLNALPINWTPETTVKEVIQASEAANTPVNEPLVNNSYSAQPPDQAYWSPGGVKTPAYKTKAGMLTIGKGGQPVLTKPLYLALFNKAGASDTGNPAKYFKSIGVTYVDKRPTYLGEGIGFSDTYAAELRNPTPSYGKMGGSGGGGFVPTKENWWYKRGTMFAKPRSR